VRGQGANRRRYEGFQAAVRLAIGRWSKEHGYSLDMAVSSG